MLITGVASGIGRELSLLFARDGANLVLDDVPGKRDTLDLWAKEISRDYSVQTWAFHIDLAEEKGTEKLYEGAKEAAGNIDVLVNDAGLLQYGNFTEIDYPKQ
ncbi:MAG: SDR family NAD(P)-dependent oxidoreductase, partial [Dehalococcoidia bacterium]|nr:SDR family NAD(P)-dependent oxidoreductase [Dehalococcoidia bacterium]